MVSVQNLVSWPISPYWPKFNQFKRMVKCSSQFSKVHLKEPWLCDHCQHIGNQEIEEMIHNPHSIFIFHQFFTLFEEDGNFLWWLAIIRGFVIFIIYFAIFDLPYYTVGFFLFLLTSWVGFFKIKACLKLWSKSRVFQSQHFLLSSFMMWQYLLEDEQLPVIVK